MNDSQNRDLVCAPWRLAHRFGGFLILPRTVDGRALSRRHELHFWERRCCFVRLEVDEIQVGAEVLHAIETPRIPHRMVPYELPPVEKTGPTEVLQAIVKETPTDADLSTLAIMFHPDKVGLAVAVALASQLVEAGWLEFAVSTLHRSPNLSGGVLVTHAGSFTIFPTT